MLLLSFRIYYGFGEFGLPFLSGFRLTHRPFSLTTFFRFPFFTGKEITLLWRDLPDQGTGMEYNYRQTRMYIGWFEKVTLAL